MAQIQVRDPARAIVLATAFLCLFVASSLTAQTPGNGGGDDELVDLIALRLESGATIDMDGRLDEEAWESAIPITDFRQQEPVEGGTPSERTEIRVVYDEDALYIGAMLYDDPEGILTFQKRRDGFLRGDDRFMTLDTFHDLRTGYYFETTATGVMGEIRVVYDEDALYIGAMLYDDPEGILAFQKRRDGFLRGDDRFMWTLDTFHDLRTGYYFETTATGVMGDGLITGGPRGGGGGGGGGGPGGGVKSRVVCKSERKLLDASVRLPRRPPSVREA